MLEAVERIFVDQYGCTFGHMTTNVITRNVRIMTNALSAVDRGSGILQKVPLKKILKRQNYNPIGQRPAWPIVSVPSSQNHTLSKTS